MKIVDIEDEAFHIFWTTWEIMMRLSGNMCLIMLKAAKKQPSSCLWKLYIWKNQNHRGVQLTPPVFLVLSIKYKIQITNIYYFSSVKKLALDGS